MRAGESLHEQWLRFDPSSERLSDDPHEGLTCILEEATWSLSELGELSHSGNMTYLGAPCTL